tara:strand:+ start:1177 stop:1578 length:402 start_codon:yes stop_codon:yes gene_type:complete
MKLLIITNPNCTQCKKLFSEGVCDGYDTELVLIPQVQTDEHLFRIIWSTENPKLTFQEMLMGNKLTQKVDFNIDTTAKEKHNLDMLEKLNSIEPIAYTPMFFTDDGIEIKSIKIPQLDIKNLIKMNMEKVNVL